MKNRVALKFAASTAMLGLTVIGCKPAGDGVASASARVAKAEEGALKAYASAQAAAQTGEIAQALSFAERAVELAPRDAGYRMLLGDLYLKNGRFVSADNAFSDVLSLDPGNPRAALSRSLALIAQGKTGEATLELDRLARTANPADIGLAFALAGQPQRAIEMLEPAARAANATGRVRQNLALAYALAGEWQKARTVAAQDLSPADVAPRLQEWAAFAKPTAPYTQVAALLGVNPVEDAGQPVRLALAPAAEAYAEAPVAEAAAPVQVAVGGPLEPVSAPAPEPKLALAALDTLAPAPAPASGRLVQAPEPVAAAAPVALAEAQAQVPAPVTAPVPEPAKVVVAEAPAQPPIPFAPPAAEPPLFVAAAEPELEDVEIAVASAPSISPKFKRIAGFQFAAAVKSLVEQPAPVARPAVKLASAPIRPFQPKPKTAAVRTGGRYVVQIGAYRNPTQVEKAWSQVQRRYGFSGREPLSTTVNIPGKGLFYRLAVSGFQAPADAARACQSVRARGGACFVRTNAGDVPLQFAFRTSGPRRA